MKEVSAKDNPIIKKFRGLSRKKYRDELGLYLIEGPNLLTEALERGAEIGQILFDEEALFRSRELQELARRAKAKAIPMEIGRAHV